MDEIQKAIGNLFEPGKLVDVTEAVAVIQNKWGLMNALGIFQEENKTQKIVQINRTHESVALMEDRNWNERKPTVKGNDRDFTLVKVPHFPLQDIIVPEDVDGNVDLDALFRGEIDVPLSVQKVMADKVLRLRRSAALTLEYARMQLLKDGTVFAPNGTVVTNFYTEFGLTRQTIPLDLASTTDNPLAKVSDVYAQVQDSVESDQIVTDVIALCSPEFFDALISNPFVVESYQYWAQPQGMEVLNQRLGTRAPLDRRYRVFDYGGVTWIEVRGGVGGERYVEEGEAYIFPRGTDSFRTFFAPANKFASVNKEAQQVYLFTTMGEKDDKIELEFETNFLNAVVRPQIVITLTMDAA